MGWGWGEGRTASEAQGGARSGLCRRSVLAPAQDGACLGDPAPLPARFASASGTRASGGGRAEGGGRPGAPGGGAKRARPGPRSASLSEAAAAEGYGAPYIFHRAQARTSALLLGVSWTRRRYLHSVGGTGGGGSGSALSAPRAVAAAQQQQRRHPAVTAPALVQTPSIPLLFHPSLAPWLIS